MIRLGNIELTLAKTLSREPEKYWEIVQWVEVPLKDSYCFTIALFTREEEPDLEWVGRRPLSEDIDRDDFYTLVDLGYTLQEKRIMLDERNDN